MCELNDNSKTYLAYLDRNFPEINKRRLQSIQNSLEETNWDVPETIDDFNRIAVVALIEAEFCDELSLRELYLETVIEALESSLEIKSNIIALFHYSIVMSMTANRVHGRNLAWDAWQTLLNQQYKNANEDLNIFYIPPANNRLVDYRSEVIKSVYDSQTNDDEFIKLTSIALCYSSQFFYNSTGLRWLQLSNSIMPDLSITNFKLGIAMCLHEMWEGIYYLKQVMEANPSDMHTIQALYLAFRSFGAMPTAEKWQALAKQNDPLSQWSKLPANSPFTYVSFDDNLILAVEANFKNLVTSTLIAEGDWFEDEILFWRDFVKPRMTIIDVGANVGVYTFSAAKRVGANGRVIAVEPFSGCVHCLQETCRLNSFDWVDVYAGAASDRQGTARLSLNSASEFNEVIFGNNVEGKFEEIPCTTLDYLINREDLNRVDAIKIDAEGHELSVLLGSQEILSKYSPLILYENIASEKSSNYEVSEFLHNNGYTLFFYQPYLKRLETIVDLNDTENRLNIIAMRKI